MAALVAWPLLMHGAGTPTLRWAAMVLGAAATWTVGGLLARQSPVVVPGLVAGAVAVLFLTSLPTSLEGGALAPPLGYANANGALLTVAVAGLVGISLADGEPPRPLTLGLAVPFVVAAFLTGSTAATAACVALLAVAPFLHRGRQGAWQVAGALIMLGAFATTIALGWSYAPGHEVGGALAPWAGNRAALWSDSLELAREHPVIGVGPGRFAELSPTAADPDLAWAHSEPLQVLAEMGFVGLALVVGLVAWLVLRLGRAAAVLGLLAVQPMVDYVLHFPMVTLTMGLVLGRLAQAGTDPSGRPGRSLRGS